MVLRAERKSAIEPVALRGVTHTPTKADIPSTINNPTALAHPKGLRYGCGTG